MSLSDTAKNLQQQAASPELLWLREMRAFVRKHTDDWLKAEWERLDDFYETPEGKTWEGQEKISARGAELHEIGELAKFYGDVLEYAEAKERKEKGGGENSVRMHWKKLKGKESSIKEKYRKERKLQVSLEDMEEGEADGNNEEENDPFAAADGE